MVEGGLVVFEDDDGFVGRFCPLVSLFIESFFWISCRILNFTFFLTIK
jgi:hypothetical protein